MNRLDELIDELCPDGVRKFAVGSFAKVQKIKNKDGHCDKAYSITKNGLVPTAEYFKDAKVTSDDTSGYRIVKRNWFVYSPSRIDVGSINFLRDADEVIVSPLNVVFSVDTQKIYPEYLLYYLQSREGTWQIITSREGIEGTGRKLLPFDKFAKIEVPVPPLEIQKEIICILTNFTEFIAELTEELTARKKQYAYYRDLLLTFDESGSTVLTDRQTEQIRRNSSYSKCWEKCCVLDLLCQPITDGPHTTPRLVPEGIPFVSVDSVWDGKIHFENKRGYITEEFDEECCKKYKPQRHDVFMVKSGSTTGKVAYVDTDERFNIWSPLAAMRVNEKNSSRFLFHLLQTKYVQEQVKIKSSHGSQPNLSMRALEKIEVYVPDLDTQNRIVSILDRFDALCNDLSSGLPAEIEARQKQYEYYRDQLLTFEPKETAAN